MKKNIQQLTEYEDSAALIALNLTQQYVDSHAVTVNQILDTFGSLYIGVLELMKGAALGQADE